MAAQWSSPIYKLKAKSGKNIIIDVTKSISAGLGPHEVVETDLIHICKYKKVKRILDFGAGVFRHTISLLKHDFEVCAVEFKEAFQTGIGSEKFRQIEDNPYFTSLIWPREFKKDKTEFDLALLSFVLQTIPISKERDEVYTAPH